jgi:hypothetical protein
MANSVIQIKQSFTNAAPISLNVGEPAYSFVSNTLFIGTPGNNGFVKIGGLSEVLRLDEAFIRANAGFVQANASFFHANGAFSNANGAFAAANGAYLHANSGFIKTNSAFDHANAAYTSQNASGQYANGAYAHANAAYANANGAFAAANGAYIQANAVFSNANSYITYNDGVNVRQNNNIIVALDSANAAHSNSNGAFAAANAAYIHANSGFIQANSGFIHANSAYRSQNATGQYANSAFIKTNSAFGHANSAFIQSNAAFTRANNSLSANVGGTVTGDVRITGNLFVTGNTTYVNTSQVLIADNILTLNAAIDQASAPILDAGIEVDRGSSANVYVLWNETIDKWTITNNGTNYYGIGSDAAEAYANSAFIQANASFDHANAAYISQNATGQYANSAFVHANSAYNSQNATGQYANSAFIHANSAFIHANSAYNSQNATGQYANSAFIHANSAYNSQNATGQYANASFIHANSAYNSQNATGQYANAAFIRANNSLNANVGGNVTGEVVIVGNLTSNTLTTTGSNGSISGANAIFTNYIFAANGNVDLYIYSSNAYANANGAFAAANAAFANANGAYIAANLAFNQANSAFIHANSAFIHANSAYNSQNATGQYANSAFIHANSAYQSQNATGNVANSGFIQSNSAFVHANSAYNSQNATGQYANSAFIHANSAYQSQNATGQYANSAFVHANSAYNSQNATGQYANSAFIQANAAYQSQNATGQYANAAFLRANNSLDANNGGTVTGNVTITQNLFILRDTTVSGNLFVLGNTFSINAGSLVSNDTLFILGSGNYTADVLDIGFASHYNDGVNAHTGFIRDAGTKEWQLFKGYTPEISANNNIDINHPSFQIDTLNANLHATYVLTKNIDLLPYANSIYDKTNAAFNSANSGFIQANSAFIHANSAYNSQNATGQYANSAYTFANAAYQSQNATGQYANSAFVHANSAYQSQNATGQYANAAFIQANLGYDLANSIANNSVEAGTANVANYVNLQTKSGSSLHYLVLANAVSGNIAVGGNTQLYYSPSTDTLSAQKATFGQSVTTTSLLAASTIITVFNTTATTIRIGGAATTINIGSVGGTTNVFGTLAVNGVSVIGFTQGAYNTGNSAFIQSNAAFNHANASFEAANNVFPQIQPAFNTANAAFIQANAAFIRANNSLDANNGGTVTGNVNVTGNVYAGNVVANTGFTSAAGLSRLQLTDIGLAAISVAGQTFQFGGSGIESNQGIFGGSFGGNRLSLNNETNLRSERYDVVKIQTGTDGTTPNEFVFSNNSLTAPGGITANGFTAGGINVVPTLSSSFIAANSAGVYANGAFVAANSAGVYANAAFAAANAAGSLPFVQTTANTANAAFIRANNSLNANVGGTITGNVVVIGNVVADAFQTSGPAGDITGANAIFANYIFGANGSLDLLRHTNSAFAIANAAFIRANNSLNANVGGLITGDVSITGNLIVTGNTVYANTQTVLIADNIITLNAAINQASAPTSDAGIEVDRGNQPNVSIIWNETTDKWTFTNDGSTYSDLGSGSDSAGSYANSAFIQANAAFAVANAANAAAANGGGVVVTYATTPPATANANGHIWIDSNDGTEYMYFKDNDGFQWVEFGPSSSNVTSNTFITANITSSFSQANAAFTKANAASQHANAGFEIANNAASLANSGFSVANGAAFSANSSTVTSSRLSSNLKINLIQVLESANIYTTAIGGNVNIDIGNNTSYFFSSNTTANVTFNLRGNTTTTFDTTVAIGQTASVAIALKQGDTKYKANVYIDGVLQTPYWLGNSSPGYATTQQQSIDVYTYTIFKTASSTYSILAANSNFGLAQGQPGQG